MSDPSPHLEDLSTSARKMSEGKATVYSGDDTNKVWYETVHRHVVDVLLPHAKDDGNRLVEYWPARMHFGWKTEYKRTAFDDEPLLYHSGTFGTGYCCLGLSALHIVSLKRLTLKYPLFRQGVAGIVAGFFQFMAGEADEIKPLTADRIYDIPMTSLLGADVIQDRDGNDCVGLRTANSQTLLYMATNNMSEAVWAIGQVRSGRLQSVLAPRADLDDKAIGQLRMLKEMLDDGLLSVADYEKMKSHVLARFE